MAQLQISELLHISGFEEVCAMWWLKTFAKIDGPIIKAGRLNKAGTPLYDTNWTPAQALIALDYRSRGMTINKIATLIKKKHSTVSDLFLRVDNFNA